RVAADDDAPPLGENPEIAGKIFPLEPRDPVSAVYVELPIVSLAQCRVTRIGIAHRFTSFDVGARCACGRKIIEHASTADLMIVDAPMRIRVSALRGP